MDAVRPRLAGPDELRRYTKVLRGFRRTPDRPTSPSSARSHPILGGRMIAAPVGYDSDRRRASELGPTHGAPAASDFS